MLKKIIRIAALSVIFAAAARSFAGEISWQRNPADALAEAKKRNTLVMVDVYTDWCQWCDRLDKSTYSNAAVSGLLSLVVPLKVNPEQSDSSASFIAPFKISGFPSILFLDSSGKLVDRIDGYVGAFTFASELVRIYRARGIAFTPPDAISWQTDEDAVFLSAKEKKRQTLVYVGMDGDDGCAAFEENSLFDPAVVAFAKKCECLKFGVGPGQGWSRQLIAYGITEVPTVLLLDPDGSIACRISGYADPDVLAGKLALDAKNRGAIETDFAEFRSGSYAHSGDLASLLFDLGRTEDLKSVYDVADARSSFASGVRIACGLKIADMHVGCGQYPEALSYLDLVDAEVPATDDSYYARYLRAIAYFYQGNFDVAMNYLEDQSVSAPVPDVWKARFRELQRQLQKTPR